MGQAPCEGLGIYLPDRWHKVWGEIHRSSRSPTKKEKTPTGKASVRCSEDIRRASDRGRDGRTSASGGVRAPGRSRQGPWGQTPGQAAGVGRAGRHCTRPASSYSAGSFAGAQGSEAEGVRRGRAWRRSLRADGKKQDATYKSLLG